MGSREHLYTGNIHETPRKIFFLLRATPLFPHLNNIGKKALIGKYFQQSLLLLRRIRKKSSSIIVKNTLL